MSKLLFDIPATARKPKRAPAELSAIDRRRYYLHKQLDESIYKIDAAKWTISIPFTSLEAVPIGPRYYVLQLKKIGYLVQFEIF